MPLTKPAALLLCLLPLGLLAPLPTQGRALLAKDQAEQKAREAAEFEQQLVTQKAWETSAMDKIRQQQRSEVEKLQEMIDNQVVDEAQQFADMTEEAAHKAVKEHAASVEQAQLEQKAVEAAAVAEQKKAERAAKRAARKVVHRARRAGKDAEQQAAEEAAAAVDGLTGGNDGNDGNNDGSSKSGGGHETRSTDSPQDDSNSGPIWGMTTGNDTTGGLGPVYATYHYYAPGYETSSLYCADTFASLLPTKADTSLLKHPWTAYCNIEGLGPMSHDKCGQCLRVTNPATGNWVKVVVVDMCGQGGIDMDPLGFNAIDGDGAGARDGHMDVHIEWTSC